MITITLDDAEIEIILTALAFYADDREEMAKGDWSDDDAEEDRAEAKAACALVDKVSGTLGDLLTKKPR